MARWIWISAFLICLLLPTRARATVGGPETLEVVGFDPKDRKVYLMREFHDEGERLPQLEYVLVGGKGPTRVIQVKSWYRGADRDDGARFQKRLAALRARLTPLEPASTVRLGLALRTVRAVQRAPSFPGDPPWDGKELEVRASVGELKGRSRVVVYDDRGVELVEARKVSKRVTLAIIRFTGIPFEMGYSTESVIVLSAAP